jgi:hypothetical protein
VVVLASGVPGLRGLWTVIKEWVAGRTLVAREREDRATTEVVLRDLAEGIWMAGDGDRIRLIIKPVTAPLWRPADGAQSKDPSQAEQSNGAAST